ncbi:hypothetical protein [Microcystis phage Mel-JY33]
MSRAPLIDIDDVPLFDRAQQRRSRRAFDLLDDPEEIERAELARDCRILGYRQTHDGIRRRGF